MWHLTFFFMCVRTRFDLNCKNWHKTDHLFITGSCLTNSLPNTNVHMLQARHARTPDSDRLAVIIIAGQVCARVPGESVEVSRKHTLTLQGVACLCVCVCETITRSLFSSLGVPGRPSPPWLGLFRNSAVPWALPHPVVCVTRPDWRKNASHSCHGGDCVNAGAKSAGSRCWWVTQTMDLVWCNKKRQCVGYCLEQSYKLLMNGEQQ